MRSPKPATRNRSSPTARPDWLKFVEDARSSTSCSAWPALASAVAGADTMSPQFEPTARMESPSHGWLLQQHSNHNQGERFPSRGVSIIVREHPIDSTALVERPPAKHRRRPARRSLMDGRRRQRSDVDVHVHCRRASIPAHRRLGHSCWRWDRQADAVLRWTPGCRCST